MKRPLRPEELKLWATVLTTVRPAPGRRRPASPAEPEDAAAAPVALAPAPSGSARPAGPKPYIPPEGIEPGRKRRIVRERELISARIDLHGLDQDRARNTLETFLRRAQDQGARSVLVITGKGSRGEGVLRRYAPEWLAAPALRGVVAGVSEAHRRHGGEGALYVALKRKAEV
ncbi:DNA mismatch repair protein MutS [Caulobacter sp. CCUG 60055]|uniref:Smr/MutS family protein n=1 Tax=Caulobacter sp. CCUG 60055 TaxID=2100090 RepID=UPI001FA70569|nr:Smr/MutS family protein [Caulobacteraceae bacterium]MCI3179827.1 DNA mismatch repair protein MutS [Caulobacter sp. CCUG 60055]